MVSGLSFPVTFMALMVANMAEFVTSLDHIQAID